MFLISFILFGCGSVDMDEFDWRLYHQDVISSEGIPYEYFTIEGMPCIRLGNGNTLYSSFSTLSCDWSKWTK